MARRVKSKLTDNDTQYEVRMRCTIIKLVTCEGCTEEQARSDPFNFSVDEFEADQEGWEVLSVKEMI